MSTETTGEPRPWMESDVDRLARELHERGEQTTISMPNMVPVEIPDPTSTTGKRTVLAPQVPMTGDGAVLRAILAELHAIRSLLENQHN